MTGDKQQRLHKFLLLCRLWHFSAAQTVSEPNSPSLTRVRMLIFGRTAAIVRIVPKITVLAELYSRDALRLPKLADAPTFSKLL
jgi:hypothetical protein